MKTALIISPHADDAAAFCGATLAKFARQGWNLILVRVTDDRKDSLGLTIPETIERNTHELHQAAALLGICEIVELGFETDVLADIPLGKLRERFVYLFRKYRPYAVFTFDPFGLYENNQDHVRVAQAVDEAFWVACFDKHYPEHFTEGLEPFSVCERWYFARQLPKATHYEEVSETFETKIAALCAHREMMRNTINQYRLQLKTWGMHIPWLKDSMDGDLRPLLAMFLQEQSKALAIEAGWDPELHLAEAFRLERFGDLEPLFQMMAEPLENAEPPVSRPGLEQAQAVPWDEAQLRHIIPQDIAERVRLMGHHHLTIPTILPIPDIFAARRVLAVQPHYDDNDIGAGGTLALLRQRGCEVIYLTITDDLMGVTDPSLSAEAATQALDRDQRQAGEIIGLSRQILLNYPDAGEYNYFALRRDLLRAIRLLKPDVVFTPDPWLTYEGHRDHIQTGLAATEAVLFSGLTKIPSSDPAVDAAYSGHEIQAIAYYYTREPNQVVDITQTWETKLAAVQCYRAQFDPPGLDELVMALYAKAAQVTEGKPFQYGEPLKVLHPRALHCGL